jgi:hypothetical protein
MLIHPLKSDEVSDLDTSSDNEASAVDTSSDMSCNDWNKSYIIFITMELFLMD